MARVKEQSFSISRRVNDGNFGSVEVSASETIELDGNEDVQAAVNAMRERVYTRFIEELNSVTQALIGRKAV